LADPYLQQAPQRPSTGAQAMQTLAPATSAPATFDDAWEGADELDDEDTEPPDAASEQMPHILELAQRNNLVDLLSDDELTRLGLRVKQEYEDDRATMEDWLSFNDRMMDLVTQKADRKTFPFDGSANTRLPLITNAVLSSHAEEMPEVIRDDEVLKAKIFGVSTPDKEARAERVMRRLNWQLFYGIPEWEPGHDRAILFKNMLGVVHKKIYWCKESARFECDVLPAGVVINDNTTSLHKAPRVTQELELPWWDVEEKFRSGAWVRHEGLLQRTNVEGTSETDKVQCFLEQIRREDIDDDGYPEPYVVTVHRDTGKVVAIVPNYTPETIWFKDPPSPEKPDPQVVGIDADRGRVRYIKYEMLPSLDGGYWSWGFIRLLGPLTDNCNTLINQLLDAGTLANTQSGFISDNIRFSREDGGRLEFQRGEWKKIKNIGGRIADNVFPLPVPQPSPVLFQLLGLLMDVVREHSNTTKLMQGEQPQSNMPAASVMALLEQGKKAFGQVFKRHRRALKAEGDALFDLSFLYESPEDYQQFCDSPQADPRADFSRAGLDVVPVAQPEFSTRVTRLAEAEALMKILQDPRVNGGEILKLYVANVLNDTEVAAKIVPDEPNKTPEQVLQALEQQKQELLGQMDVKAKEFDVQVKEIGVRTANAQNEAANIDVQTSLARLALAQQQAKNPPKKGE
jgi:chaperonin GroES